MLNIKTFVCNPLSENTYVVSDETKECVIIDCGAYYDGERDALTNYINDNHLKPVHLLCTHGHFDHNYGIDTIYNMYGLKAEIGAGDDFLISDIAGQFKKIVGVQLNRQYPAAGHFFGKDEVVRFGNHQLQVLPTPGHTPGGVTFYCKEEAIAFSGDTLFRMSVGRTDFEGGDFGQLQQSLKEVLGKLPAETKVYCGHGPTTTIGDELAYNPYLR